jgi:hypothetical protein
MKTKSMHSSSKRDPRRHFLVTDRDDDQDAWFRRLPDPELYDDNPPAYLAALREILCTPAARNWLSGAVECWSQEFQIYVRTGGWDDLRTGSLGILVLAEGLIALEKMTRPALAKPVVPASKKKAPAKPRPAAKARS